MPLTLTAVYMLVARRVGIRAAAIPLPGHVMLRLYAGRRTLIVDPFRGGRLRTRSECTRYLEQQGLVPNPAWFRDASDAALFQRQLLNLMNSCQLRGMTGLARELHRVAAVLGRPDSRSVGARRA
jgi:regulator of sirC expression with transglutaminase-like and TPR domain